MANFSNYQDGNTAMLMMEKGQQPRDAGVKPATANGDVSVGEPPSPVINIGGGGGGGASRFHQQHLPPSSNHHSSPGQPKDQPPHPLSNLHHYQPGQQQQQQHLSGEITSESPGRKASSSVSAAEDAAASGSGHVYAAVNVVASNTSEAVDDIRKCGYLRKQKHGHKRFFVLRAASHIGPSRLEYYDSEKKFRNSLRSAAAAAAAASGGAVAPSPPKRVIYLYQCFTVNKRADSKNKHLIALYTKDEYFAIVAESEQEQEDWYVAVSELMNEGKKGHVDSDDLDDGYGTVTPGTVFKEVWQVNVKPKGLGQTKNLTGVYRLCLSTKTLHLVKLNSETPCVNLQLMNIRRCGHSESFFFIEVGRSSSIGPGEIWMQVDDSVVAQNMHETILETMKALKAFTEFRPRSKSQSSGSNPMPFITTRRHLGNLPPSQTGLQRRSRTESVVGTPPSSKSSGASGYRFRTSSEGEGTMNRPFRSATGSLVHLNTTRAHLGRHDAAGACGVGVATGNAGTSTGSGGGGGSRCYVRAIPGLQQASGCCHARSASLPVSHYPSATSPVSVSSSSGHGSVSDTLTRPSSASICGSPSDGGFNSSDEYGSSPGDFRYLRVRSSTPDSLGNTPPIREEHLLNDYMTMGWHRDVFGAGPAEAPRDEGPSTGADDERPCPSSSSLRRRAHSFTRAGAAAGGATGGSGVAVYQKMTQTTFSLDERDLGGLAFGGGGLLRGGPPSSSSSSLRSDYSSCSEHSQQSRPSTNAGDHHHLPPPSSSSSSSSPSSSSTAKGDGGYMPMMCGVAAAASPRDTPPDYMPMQPGSSPSPQFHSPALAPRSAHLHQHHLLHHHPHLHHPTPSSSSSSSPSESHGYMMMLPGGSGGSSSPVQSSPGPHGGAGGGRRGDSIAERPENAEYMDMSHSGGAGSGGHKPPGDAAAGGYYALGAPDPPANSHSPYFSLPRSYKAPTPRQAEAGEYGEYVPMSSPAKPGVSPPLPASGSGGSTPERRGGSARTPPHPPPPYSAAHANRPNRLALGRCSLHWPARAGGTSAATASAGTSTSASDRPPSPGEYINIEFGERGPPPLPPGSSFPLSAQEEVLSPGSGVHCCSPHQDYMSVEVGGKSQSPRPSLVAPWNPPSYIRPLAAHAGGPASPGRPPRAGGHWTALGDDYTDMTFNLGRGGEGPRASPTAVLQHLCVMEGHYGHPASSSSSCASPNPPGSPSRTGTEPKVVRADPQGRRRHSSETFTSPSSSGGATPAGPPAASPLPDASNGSPQADGLPSRWSGSGSFDSVWMSVEGLGESAASRAHARAPDPGALSSSSSSSSGRMCRNMSSGYQNGLNYIALELREEAGATATAAAAADSPVAGSNGSLSPAETTPPPSENGGYASIDFTKSTEAVTSANKD